MLLPSGNIAGISRRSRLPAMAMDDRWGRPGSTRALEVTGSAANGWHPHLHVLLYFGEQLTVEQVVKLTEVIYAAYRRGLERRGFSVARTATRTPSGHDPVGAEYCVTLRDLGVFVDEAAEPVPPQNADTSPAAGGSYVRRAGSGAASGAADGRCSDRHTRPGPAAGAVRR